MDTQFAKNANRFSSRILIGIIAGVMMLVLGVIVWNVVQIGSVNSFAACAEKYPVLESYPERCRTPDGRIFTKQY